jgi:hypothetical protein
MPMIGIANGHSTITPQRPACSLRSMPLDSMSSGWQQMFKGIGRQLCRRIFRAACSKEVMLSRYWGISLRL